MSEQKTSAGRAIGDLLQKMETLKAERDECLQEYKARFDALMACVDALKFAGKRLVTPADYAEMWRIAQSDNDIVERLK